MRFTFCLGREGLLVAVLAVSGIAFVSQPVPADTLSTFDARAAASGVNVTVENPSIPLGLVLQGAGPIARAALDSLGTSQALSAGPYPGDLAASLPGTVRTTSGLPLPDYPLLAATTLGDAPKELVAPGMSLRAESRERRSTSRATIGTDSSGSTSTASTERDDAGAVRAAATARTDVLRVLDRLTLSGVIAEATTTTDETGNRSSTSSLRIDAIDAAGLVIAVPEKTPSGGLPDLPPIVSGQPDPPKPPPSDPAPLPAGGTKLAGPVLRFTDGRFTVVTGTGDKPNETPVPAETVATAFKALGVEMRYQAAQPTETGVIAPLLSFRTTLPTVPDNPTAFQGATTVTLEVGRVATSVAGQASPAPEFGLPDPVNGVPLPESGPPPEATADILPGAGGESRVAQSEDLLSGIGIAHSGAGAGSAYTDQANASVPPEAPGPGASEAAAGAPRGGSALSRAVGRTVDAGDVYVVFVVVAAVAVAAGSLLRKVGVRF